MGKTTSVLFQSEDVHEIKSFYYIGMTHKNIDDNCKTVKKHLPMMPAPPGQQWQFHALGLASFLS